MEMTEIMHWLIMGAFLLLLGVFASMFIMEYRAETTCEATHGDNTCGYHKCMSEASGLISQQNNHALKYQNCLLESKQ